MPATGDPPPENAGHLPRVARGEAGAMEACIDAYGGLIWSIVQRRVRDHSAAEDLTQEILTEVWKNAGRFDASIASESGFVAMIARRRAIDWVRKQQRLPEMAPLPEASQIAGSTDAPDAAADREAVWRALDHLPDETRRLFTLHFEQGMTHSEISENTGLPLGSVKTRLRRGLIEARALLKRLGAGVQSSPEAMS